MKNIRFRARFLLNKIMIEVYLTLKVIRGTDKQTPKMIGRHKKR